MSEWQQRSGSGTLAPIHKFKNAGEFVEGVFLGLRNGTKGYSPLAQVKTSGGVIAVPAPVGLFNQLAGDDPVPSGTEVKIVYDGKKPTKDGKRTFNAFTLFTKGLPEKPAGAPVSTVQVSVQQPAAVVPPVSAPIVAPVAAAPAPASIDFEYDLYEKKLAEVAGTGAAGLLNALKSMYPEPAARKEQIKTALRQYGVQV